MGRQKEILAEASATAAHRVSKNAKPLCIHLTFWTATTIFGILYSVFVYNVLLKGNPQVGTVLLTASSTNYLVSVFSQVFTMLTDMTIKNHLDALRWGLAARQRGVSGSTFFQLSGATDLLYIALLTLACRLKNWWGVLRLGLPIVALYLGSILKFRADFSFYFDPDDEHIPIFAGLMPPDTTLLKYLPTHYVCIFFAAWVPTLTGFQKFSTGVHIDGCDEKCTAYFLPGGLEVARQVGPRLTNTIFEHGLFNGTKDVRINNAPGYLLRYEELGSDFQFDLRDDCLYYGETVGDGIQICISDQDGSVAVGWSACPTMLRDSKRCNETSWHSTMRHKVLLTSYRQFATTVYSWELQKIQHVETTSEPIKQNLSRAVYEPVWEKIFVEPTSQTDEIGKTQVRSLLVSLGWLLRLYNEDFPDDPYTPLSHLHNFMAIPMQFTTVCMEYVNSTIPWFPAPLPADMLTTAQRGMTSDRLVSEPWTVWAFIGSSMGLLLLVGTLLAWLLLLPKPLPKSSGLAEIDMLEIVGNGPDHVYTSPYSEDYGSVFMRLNKYVQTRELAALPAWKMARVVSRSRMKLVDEGVYRPDGARSMERTQEESLLAYIKEGPPDIYMMH